jgi:OPA family glycerol-3-phosphate transporter-like MFS transporter/OPA family sugar phosphate sensor protein UhpC-like MFS transporter
MLLFWKLPGQSRWLSTLLLCCAGFFIYGPQALVGTVTANLATKRAAATAIGFTSIFAYASTVLSGWGLGLLVQRQGLHPSQPVVGLLEQSQHIKWLLPHCNAPSAS